MSNRKNWVVGRLRLLNRWIQLYELGSAKADAYSLDIENWYGDRAVLWYDERDALVDEYMHNMCWRGDHTFNAHGVCVRCNTGIGAGV